MALDVYFKRILYVSLIVCLNKFPYETDARNAENEVDENGAKTKTKTCLDGQLVIGQLRLVWRRSKETGSGRRLQFGG